LGRTVGENGSGGDEEVAKAVHTEVWADDAGVRIDTHASAAHGVPRVVEVRDGCGDIGCEEREVPVNAVEIEASAKVLSEGAEGGEFSGIDAPVEDGLEFR
jgi:hypothetical protein